MAASVVAVAAAAAEVRAVATRARRIICAPRQLHWGPARVPSVCLRAARACKNSSASTPIASHGAPAEGESSQGARGGNTTTCDLIFERPGAAPRRIFRETTRFKVRPPRDFHPRHEWGALRPTCVCRRATCSPSPLKVATGQRPLDGRDRKSVGEISSPGITHANGSFPFKWPRAPVTIPEPARAGRYAQHIARCHQFQLFAGPLDATPYWRCRAR